MKFILEENTKENLTFNQVETNQFFIDGIGFLCQKTHETAYCAIADDKGIPYSNYLRSVAPTYSIKKILPQVAKIEF